eukprot:c12257_g1_i7.p1 GENE.c12257_g1_i7~~c12257_g1_i7.p1  ORF type:complete len:662 (+),score=203.09 c12257_g1_i7:726-2711(+)
MTYDSNFVSRADAYVDAGMIPLCYEMEKKYGEEEKIKSIYILGMFCFNNERAATIVGDHSGFLDLLQRSLDPSKSEALMRAGLYLMTNTSSNSYSTHIHLVHMLPRLRDILDESSGFDQGPRSEAVRVCFYLSSNEETKSRMLDAAVIDPLVAIMASGVLALDCVSAAIAVANLVGDEEDSPALAAGAGAHGFYQLLIDALEAALNGTDYPVQSNLWYRNWKIVQGLANLSKADINKEKLGASGLIPLLKRALDMDDTDSLLHKYSVLTLWNLSFDEANCRRIKDNGSLRLEIDRLKDFGSSEEIKRAAQGIMWQLDNLEKELRTVKKRSESIAPRKTLSGKPRGGHVMCSYCWAQQEVMVEIKETLESRGFRMWMDVDRMQGSTLEAMANAVEGADVILMGLSKDYKNSGACRTEGEFAYKLNKPMVPLLLEPRYTADGWLGALVGTKLYYDFTNEANFDKTMDQLVKALGEWGRGGGDGGDGDSDGGDDGAVASSSSSLLLSQNNNNNINGNAGGNGVGSSTGVVGARQQQTHHQYQQQLQLQQHPPQTTPPPPQQQHSNMPYKALTTIGQRASEKESFVEKMTKDDVAKWLGDVGLTMYVEEFQKKNVDGQVLLCANMIMCKDNDGHQTVLEDFRTEFAMNLGDSYRFVWHLKILCGG